MAEIKLTFLEYGHVAYQSNRNEAYNTGLENSTLPLAMASGNSH